MNALQALMLALVIIVACIVAAVWYVMDVMDWGFE